VLKEKFAFGAEPNINLNCSSIEKTNEGFVEEEEEKKPKRKKSLL